MERMTRAEAARALGVDKSTMTRWVQNHPALLGEDGLVDLAQMRQHRDAVINPKLQTRGINAGGGASAQTAAAPAVVTAPAALPNLNLHRERSEYAKAVGQELDLAERLRLTLVRSDVEAQVAAAGELLRRTASGLAKDKAEQLARIEDPRQMERALDDMMRALLEQGANALIAALAASAAANADGAEESDAA